MTGRGRRAVVRVAALLATVLGSGALMVAVPGAASAHPLGNFTVNRYSGLVVSTDAVRVDHVRDLAEIPTAQRTPDIDTSGDDRLSAAELAAWAGAECRQAARRAAAARSTGSALPLAVARAGAEAPRGPGRAADAAARVLAPRAGLTLRAGTTVVRLTDTSAGAEVGWKEMTAVGDGATVVEFRRSRIEPGAVV